MELNQNEMAKLVAQLAGEDTIGVAEFIISKGENISEFLIAESLNLPINAIRNILYRLQENNLVTFIRKKDKKKGWYIYYWTFNHAQSVSMMKRMKENRISNLRSRLEREDSSHFYTCLSKCLRLKFEHAMDNDFKCPECNKVLVEQDNKKIIKKIKRELLMLEETSESEPSVIGATA